MTPIRYFSSEVLLRELQRRLRPVCHHCAEYTESKTDPYGESVCSRCGTERRDQDKAENQPFTPELMAWLKSRDQGD
jgi:tRNA(Ile2) C34 agmatinyltransferase TiaS